MIVEPLAPSLDLTVHWTKEAERARMATVLDAYFTAIKRIDEHYAAMKIDRVVIDRQYPYQTTLGDSSKPMAEFHYIDRVPGKLVFFAHTAVGERLCVKFTRQYSADVHEYMAKLGLAPRLLGIQNIPGGWKMVVTDYSDYIRLAEMAPNANTRMVIRGAVLAAIQKLHDGGYVHGDIRDVNILVNTESCIQIHIIDFDWAGRIGEATYPLEVNTVTLKRPMDVTGGGQILQRHDIEMAHELFS